MPLKGKQPSGILTQQKMLRSAVMAFVEKGYEGTTTAEIARGAGMTPSSFFRAFPSKDALLLELAKWIYDGQYDLAREVSHSDDPMLICAVEAGLELHTAELSEPLRELYVAAYTIPAISDYIRRSMAKRLHQAFGGDQPGLQAKDFYEIEIACAGILREYMVVPCDVYFTIETKIMRFLDCSLKLVNIGPERRNEIINATLALDLHGLAEQILRSTIRKNEDGVPITGHLIY